MRKAIADPYVLGYCVVYSLAVIGLRFTEHFPLSEAVAATVIFAIVLVAVFVMDGTPKNGTSALSFCL